MQRKRGGGGLLQVPPLSGLRRAAILVAAAAVVASAVIYHMAMGQVKTNRHRQVEARLNDDKEIRAPPQDSPEEERGRDSNQRINADNTPPEAQVPEEREPLEAQLPAIKVPLPPEVAHFLSAAEQEIVDCCKLLNARVQSKSFSGSPYGEVLSDQCAHLVTSGLRSVREAAEAVAEDAWASFDSNVAFEKSKRSLRAYIDYFRMYLTSRRNLNSADRQLAADLNVRLRKVSVDVDDFHVAKDFGSQRASRIQDMARLAVEYIREAIRPCKKTCCCGWGCRLSHGLWCWFAAVATGQRVTFKSPHSIRMGAPSLFNTSILVSPTDECDADGNKNNRDAPHWPNMTRDLRQSNLNPNAKRAAAKTMFKMGIAQKMPPFVPRRLLDLGLLSLVDDHAAWYVGQFTGLLQAPSDLMVRLINNRSQDMNSQFRLTSWPLPWSPSLLTSTSSWPLAGIHVRRTDKSHECSPQPLDKYMALVEDFFLKEDLRRGASVPRQVFVATDEPSIIDETKKKFGKRYLILHSVHEKKNDIDGFLMDVLTLAHVDFFVGTYSSNVGRTIYQLRHFYRLDAEATSLSLDTEWFFHDWPQRTTYTAVANHTSVAEELYVTAGEALGAVTVDGGHNWSWFNLSQLPDGLIAGANLNRHKWGFFPRFKVQLDLDYLNQTGY